MPYRTDLKRPDLKGQFPCSVCNKIFCHSSSLSRHRMQAHYKCYICTQCNQEIHSSETLRSHMYRCHSIQRMFMCRCCNWAFPDKTSLHIHMQSMQKSGKPGDVSVLARSSLEKSEMVAAEAERERYGSPSNSSPDEEQHFRGDSISPSISEMEEQQQHNLLQLPPQQQIKMEEGSQHFHGQPPLLSQQQNINATSIFPNQMETSSAEFILSKFGIKTELEERAQPINPQHHQSQAMLLGQQQQSTIPLSIFHHQPWFSQLLANNPYFASVIEQKSQQQLQQQQAPLHNVKGIQSFCAALASAAASRAQNNATHLNTSQVGSEIPSSTQPPPQKKQKRNERKKEKNGGNIRSTSTEDLSLQIPQHQQNPMFQRISPAMSEGSNAGKLNSLISNLLSIRSSGQNSPAEEDGKTSHSNSAMSERKNKRKMRTPTRTTEEMAEIIYGDEPEGEFPGQSANITFPCIQRFMDKSEGRGAVSQDTEQQPSPAVSDSQTSGSINGGHMEGGMMTSPKKCDNCEQVAKLDSSIMEKNTVTNFHEQIKKISAHISLLAGSINEIEIRKELLTCARQLCNLMG